MLNIDMTINIADYTVDFAFAESKQSVFDSLLNSRAATRVLFGENDYYSKYMVINYRKEGSTRECEQGAIGVLFNTGGYLPHITPLPWQPVFLLGYNQSLVMYDMSKHKAVFEHSLPSAPFYCKCFREGIVVLSELDITEISYSGEVMKEHHLSGILTDYHFSDLTLIYSLDDGTVGKSVRLFEE